MFDRHRKKAAVLFAAADVALLIVAFEAAYQVRAFLPLPLDFYIITPIKGLVLGFTLLLWLGSGWWLGVYERLYGNLLRAAVYDTFNQVALTTLSLVAFQFFFKLDASRVFIGLFAVFSFALLLFYRVSARPLRGWIRRQFGAEAFHVIVGWGQNAVEVGRRLEEASEYGSRLVAFVDPGDNLGESVQLKNAYPVWRLSELSAKLRADVIDEIIFSVEAEKLAELEDVFLLCDEEGVRTRVVIDFFPHVHSNVYLDRFGPLSFLTFSTTPDDEIRLFVKRSIDVVLASLSLILLSAPMLLLSLLVRATSKGPAIFRQIRCGLNGRTFIFYKFRSMVDNADALKAELEHLNERDGPIFKISDDPRLTGLGRYIRRFSIDEWPQFWNILKGDMSFVGPRPAGPSEVCQYAAWQRRRLRMRPGLTCLWALHGRDQVDFDTWMKLDLQYIDNWSLGLDLKILLRSIPRVLAGRGAS
ncbi:MAG: sugar transferase [Acidobacteria bacterium]|nr:sugar transferase [Acidobacteriota bacterium]